MPSSLIIVALAAAWLVVLVPMVARRRQEVARPADSALSARVVRSGSARDERRKEFAMSEKGSEHHGHVDDEPFDDVADHAEVAGYDDVDWYDDGYADDYETSDYTADDADAYDESAPAHRP